MYFGASNTTDDMLQIGVMPKETMQIRLQYHHMTLDNDTGYSDDALYDEYNLFVEFFPDDRLYFGVMVGLASRIPPTRSSWASIRAHPKRPSASCPF